MFPYTCLTFHVFITDKINIVFFLKLWWKGKELAKKNSGHVKMPLFIFYKWHDLLKIFNMQDTVLSTLHEVP